MPLYLLLIAAIILILTVITGFLVLLAGTTLGIEDCWALSGAAGCAIVALIAFVAFLTNQTNRLFCLGALLALILACVITIRYRKRDAPFVLPRWIMFVLVLWAVHICVEFTTPLFRGAFSYGDWWMHFDISLFYLGVRPGDIQYFGQYTIPSRTPLFNLFSSYYLAIFHREFFVYQIASLVPGVALFGVLSRFFERRLLGTALFLYMFNPYLSKMILVPWPKILAATYTLAAIYLYMKWQAQSARSSQGIPGWSICLGFAVLTHSASILYVLAIFLDYCVSSGLRKRTVTNLAIAGAVVVACLGPWLLWVTMAYGVKSVWTSSPTAVAQSGILSAGWFGDRVITIVGTLLPLPLMSLGSNFQARYVWDSWLRLYYGVLPGACTITGTALLLRSWRRQQRFPTWSVARLFGIITVVGFVGGILLQPGRQLLGIAQESMAPIVLLALIMMTAVLDTLPPIQYRVVLAFIGLEFILSRGLHMIDLALSSTPSDDVNLLLKQQHHLTFVRDIIGPAWVAFALAGITGYILIAYLYGARLRQVPGAAASTL